MFPPDLERATDRLYAAFAHHRLPPGMAEACDHCVGPAEVDAFLRTPLRALTPRQLGTYLSNPGTWGDGTVGPYLADLSELTGEVPARHLAEVVDAWSWGGSRSLSEDANRVLRRWLVDGTPGRLLWEAAVAVAGSPVAGELTRAAEHADLLRDALAEGAA
jgi:hypothetical protein